VVVAGIVVAFELIALAVIRWKFFQTGFLKSLFAVSVGGAVIAVVGSLIGSRARASSAPELGLARSRSAARPSRCRPGR